MLNLFNYIIESFNNAHRGDEFYTRMSDIERELKNYDFTDKSIYCNCDDPGFSNFYKYFKDNFKRLHLKKLMATYYDDNPKLFIYNGKSEKSENIKSGRFQDNEKYIQQCDIVVTNPPFSDNMPAELVNIILHNHKDFIIIGPLHLCKNKAVFPYIKNETVNAGYTLINTYILPDGSTTTASTCWYTTFSVKRKKLHTGKKYNPDNYIKYDNYDAIECKPYTEIPDDYMGNISVSYRFITHLCREQFKIIDKIIPVLNGKKQMTKLIIKRK